MPLIICTKFQINQVIVTLFSGVWDKNPTLVSESRKMPKAIGLRLEWSGGAKFCTKEVCGW